MKRYLTVILCIALVLLLWGCKNNASPDETTDATTTETVADVPTDTPLTEEELRWFTEEFFSNVNIDAQGERVFNIRNMFLRCEFDAPENIDLGLLFREGLGEYDAVSQEEKVLYNEVIGYELFLDYTKVTREDMETIFLANTGLHPDETAKVGLDNLVYLEQYDAYYHCHGDTAYLSPEIYSGERAEDGTVTLWYQDGLTSLDALWCVTLKPAGDTYHFVSNLPAE